MKSHEAALQEAWEEAGVKTGNANAQPARFFTYQKTQATGWGFPVQNLVYSVAVTELSKAYPEASACSRTWVSANDAAEMVDEPELQQILHAMATWNWSNLD